MNQESSPKLPWTLWGILTLISAGLVIMLIINEGKDVTTLGWVSLILGFSPLIGAQLTLGSPRAAGQIRAWLQNTRRPLLSVAGGISALYLLSGLIVGSFDPYATVIFVFGAFAALGTLRQIQRGQPGLTWADAAVWLMIWIPFDLRWNYDLWYGPDGFAYNWWSVALTVLAVAGWYGLRELPDFGYNLAPTWKDIRATLIVVAGLLVIVVPIGLGIDFLTFPPTAPLDIVAILVNFTGIFLTVAIPEELFFRGILLHGLDQMYKKRPWVPLLLSSLAFGLMHWNNASDLMEKIAYCALATVAGLFNGWAYRRTGNKLLAPVLAHTLTDVIWVFVFQ